MSALLVIKKAWLLDADWLSIPALHWFPTSNRFLKGISEIYCFWVPSKGGYFILMWKKINMQQSAVFWCNSQKTFPSKNVLIPNLTAHLIGIKTSINFVHMLNFCDEKESFGFNKLLELNESMTEVVLCCCKLCKTGE